MIAITSVRYAAVNNNPAAIVEEPNEDILQS